MPQQKLSNVRRNAKVYDSPEALERRPELAGLFALALANWAEIEVRLIAILTSFLGHASAPATAMVQLLRSSNTQIQVIRAAGKAVLKDPELEFFEAIMNIAERVAKKRNLLVHDTWGYCDELPDALLRIEVESSVRIMVNLETIIRNKTPLPEPPEVHADLKLDPNHVWVYRYRDFENIIAEMKKLRLYITLMHHFVGPQRDHISATLDNEPLLQEELIRVRASR